MDTALSPPVGQLLGGRYHIGSRIARGGMATVYVGTDTRLDRVVAVKIAHPELSDDVEFVRRFIGEARSAARLSSPNVVAVYDQGSDGRLHYIAMEYVPGRTLRELLSERGRLGARESLDIMTGVLAGLAAAHEAGFAHRDVKPENVLLTANGGVKVADFGLARSVAGAVQTKGGMIIGTAAYLAPEQVAGGVSDARTDVYAAGVMLFELLTGTQPHTGESPLAVAYKHVNNFVPAPSSVLPGLSPALDALVAMATSRDPELRPANAGQFLRAIEEIREGRTAPGISPYSAPAGTGPHRLPGQPGGDRNGGLISPQHAWGDEQNPADQYPPPPWESASGVVVAGASALPSLGPQSTAAGPMLPVPGADVYPSVNHTLIVAADGLPADYPGTSGRRLGAGYADHGGRYAGRRGAPRRSEPWLQQLLFSRRFIYLSGGLALVLVAALLGWWLTSGQYTTIPPLRGIALPTAKTELRNLGLHAELGTPVHNPLAKGDVIATKPAIGAKVTSGSTVTLIVSLGPVLIQVPNVSGQPLSQAEAALRAAHLTPGQVSKQVSSTVPVGDVISTTPHAYATWPQAKPVGLTVSEGPGLPNFVGMSVSDAQAAAQAGGYTINPVADTKSDQPADTITSQSPPANTPITSGEVVTVRYSPGPPVTPVPNVQGMSVHDAIRALRDAGFQWTVNKTGPGNQVCSYSPNTPQPKGTVISLNVGGLFCGF
jgi:serine/threonine-protein kinase